MKAFMISVALTLVSSLTFAAAPHPASFTADYTASKGNISVGLMQRSLAPAGEGKYIFKSDMQATGVMAVFVKDQVSESSVWSFSGGALQPQHYRYDKSGGKKSRQINLQFDWPNSVARNSAGGKQWQVALAPGTQDALSYQAAIMYDLQRGNTRLIYPIADKKGLKNYRFRIAGHENIDTPLGKLDTVKLTRILDSDEKTTTLWCAPSLDYLPVRIEQNEKGGGEYSLLIKSVQGLGR